MFQKNNILTLESRIVELQTLQQTLETKMTEAEARVVEEEQKSRQFKYVYYNHEYWLDITVLKNSKKFNADHYWIKLSLPRKQRNEKWMIWEN